MLTPTTLKYPRVPGRKGASFDGWALITNYEAPASTLLENPGAKAYFITNILLQKAIHTVTVTGGTADMKVIY